MIHREIIQPERTGPVLVRPAKPRLRTENYSAIITACDKVTGKAKVKKAEGTIGSLTIVSGASETVVWMGKESWSRVDDEVLVAPAGAGIQPEGVIIANYTLIMNATNAEPTAGELAATQDSPSQCTTCCDESVT